MRKSKFHLAGFISRIKTDMLQQTRLHDLLKKIF